MLIRSFSSLMISVILFGCGTGSDSGEHPGSNDTPLATVKGLEAYCTAMVSCGIQDESIFSCAKDTRSAERGSPLFAYANALFTCVLDAGADCTEVKACKSGKHVSSCKSRCDGTFAISCESDDEGGSTEKRDDCAVAGEDCIVDANGFAACGLDRCEEDQPARCDGDYPIRCIAGVERLTLCDPGDHCDDSVDVGEDVCVNEDLSSAPACSASRCDGNVAVFCGEKIEQGRADCSLIAGKACEISREEEGAYPDAHCMLPKSVTEACKGVESTCKNGVITDCFVAGPRTYDCIAHGWAGCELRTHNETGAPLETAICTPK